MKNILLGLILMFVLSACNLDIEPKYNGGSYSTETYSAFEGVIDSVNTVFRFGAAYYTCNSADNLIYVFDTGATVLNSDSTQASCNIDLFARTDVSEDNWPVMAKP